MSNSSGFHHAVLTIAGILAILLIVCYAQAIMVPFLLSLFIAIIMAIPVGWLKKRGTSVPVSVGIVVVATVLIEVLLALINLATGILIGIGLALVGLDFAVLWGFLAFVLNFIPNIGSVLAAVPAELLSLLQLSPLETLIVIAIYLAANTLMGNMVEPAILGRRVGLSALTVFMSLVFWGWLLGPVGMLLSVPMTMVIKFAAQASDQTRWLAVLLAPAPLPGTQAVGQGQSTE